MTITDLETYMTLEDTAGMASSISRVLGQERAIHALRVSSVDLDLLESGDSTPLTLDRTLKKRILAWVIANNDELFRAAGGPIPPFDHLKDFWVNFYQGPRNGQAPVNGGSRVENSAQSSRLLDFTLNLPFGVPACALTPHSGYINYFSERGFDLLTYKTVRDRPWNPHLFPHWAFSPSTGGQLSAEDVNKPVVATLDPGIGLHRPKSLVNSFGVPSLSPDEWEQDVADTKRLLRPGQVLIVSVMGSPEEAANDDELAAQFANAARIARDAGADIIEANLSCPNTGGELICAAPDTSAKVVVAISNELKATRTPLFIKISYLNPTALASLVERCGRLIQGIVAINTVSVPVVTRAGKQFFPGEARARAGISGDPIRSLGLQVVRQLVEIREASYNRSDWAIIGVGGVTSPEHFKQYRDLGADAVQSCSGAWLDPDLARSIRNASKPQRPEGHLGSIVIKSKTTQSAGGAEEESHITLADRDQRSGKASTLSKIGRALSTGGLSLIFESKEAPKEAKGAVGSGGNAERT